MKLRTGFIALAAALACAPVALGQPAPRPSGAQALNVQNADIRIFIQDVSRATGINFVVDPRVQGTVSVNVAGPLSPRQLFDVFLSTLRAHGYVAVPVGGGAYRIQPAEGAATQPGVAGGLYVTETFRLRNIDARTAAESIRPFVGPQGQVSTAGNALVVADFADNISRIRRLVNEIDVDRSSVQSVPLAHISAREAAGVLNALMGGPGADPARPRAVMVVAVESTNSVIMRGDPQSIARLMPVLTDLDRRAEARGGVQVIFLQHASAAQVLPVLQQLIGQASGPAEPAAAAGAVEPPASGSAAAPAAPAAASAVLGAQRATVVRYPSGNALIIAGDAAVQRMLLDVIRRLDVPREQVLVEAIVVEVSDDLARELGVQYALGGRNGAAVPFAATSYSTGPNVLAIAGAVAAGENLDEDSPLLAALRETAVNSVLGAGGLFGVGGASGDVLFGAILNAVRRDTTSNLLSTPSILTLNNTPASIMVGQEVPITTGEVLGDSNSNPFRTIQRQSVGIKLDVTPQIGAGGQVILALRQEVSAVAGPVSADFNELVINKREVATTISVTDGEIVVLGGLLDQNERLSVEGIPYLADIPVLGRLFRSDQRTTGRRNLLIFIRTRIVRTPDAAAAITAQRYGYIRSDPALTTPAGDSQLDGVVSGYIAAPIPPDTARLPAPAETPPPPPPPPPGAAP